MIIIGLTGEAGCGKTTASMALVRNMGFELHNFAAPIKEALNTLFGWNMRQWDDREWKETLLPYVGVSPRRLAQTLGTDWARDIIDPDFWVKLLGYRVTESPKDLIVIGDLRFENEALWVEDHGGYVIEVTRPDQEKIEGAQHSSEAGLPLTLVTHHITNGGSIKDLETHTINMVADIMRAHIETVPA